MRKKNGLIILDEIEDYIYKKIQGLCSSAKRTTYMVYAVSRRKDITEDKFCNIIKDLAKEKFVVIENDAGDEVDMKGDIDSKVFWGLNITLPKKNNQEAGE